MSRPTILIVDDEAAIADSIAYALEREGFMPRHLMLGEAALAACILLIAFYLAHVLGNWRPAGGPLPQLRRVLLRARRRWYRLAKPRVSRPAPSRP